MTAARPTRSSSAWLALRSSLDNGNNETPETAQEVAVPCEIAGHVEKLRDRDWYSFAAKKGDTYNIDILSDRLGAPTYMYFMLKNDKKRSEGIGR